jgi:hypothetical protein
VNTASGEGALLLGTLTVCGAGSGRYSAESGQFMGFSMSKSFSSDVVLSRPPQKC